MLGAYIEDIILSFACG